MFLGVFFATYFTAIFLVGVQCFDKFGFLVPHVDP